MNKEMLNCKRSDVAILVAFATEFNRVNPHVMVPSSVRSHRDSVEVIRDLKYRVFLYRNSVNRLVLSLVQLRDGGEFIEHDVEDLIEDNVRLQHLILKFYQDDRVLSQEDVEILNMEYECFQQLGQ